MSESNSPKIVSVHSLTGRSLRVDYDDGAVRLFDGFRLRGPQFIPLVHPENFVKAVVKDGNLYWEESDITIEADYVRKFSVPYDPDYKPEEYVRTKRDIIGEKIAVVLFPAMAIAGLVGTVWWYINN